MRRTRSRHQADASPPAAPYDGADDRRRGRHPLPRGGGRRGLLRHPRRRHPARSTTRWPSTQTRSSTCSCATSRAPATWRRATRASPARSASAMATSGPGRDEPRHAGRRRVPRLDADGRHHRPGADAPDRHGRLPGGRHTGIFDADRQALLPRARRSRTSRACSRRRSTSPRTGRPGPVLIDIPKDVAQARVRRSAGPTPIDLPGYRPTREGHPLQIQAGGRGHRRVAQAAGALRRRRRRQRRRRGRAARRSPRRRRCPS